MLSMKPSFSNTEVNLRIWLHILKKNSSVNKVMRLIEAESIEPPLSFWYSAASRNIMQAIYVIFNVLVVTLKKAKRKR